MIKYYFRTIKDEAIKEIDGVRNGVWVHVQSPTNVELESLSKELSLDMDILEDAQDFFEVPRLERDGDISYFFTRYPFNEQNEDTDTAPLLIVMGEAFVLTITQRAVPQFEALISGKTTIYTTQKTKLFIQMMEVITMSFERQLISLRKGGPA
jgi:Mg2+ and Co2+ transporter CorA